MAQRYAYRIKPFRQRLKVHSLLPNISVHRMIIRLFYQGNLIKRNLITSLCMDRLIIPPQPL